MSPGPHPPEHDLASDAPRASCALSKLVIGAMLLEMPVDAVLRFWERWPLRGPREELRGRRLLEHLWNDRNLVPLDYMSRAFQGLESFLDENGTDRDRFFGRFHSINKGTVIPSKLLLSALKPVLSLLFCEADLRHLYLLLSELRSRLVLPDSLWRIVAHRVENGWNQGVMIFVPDQRFPADAPPAVDPEAWITRVIRAAPKRLELPPLEEVETIADMRPLESLLGDRRVEQRDGALLVDGAPAGRMLPLETVCETHGVPSSAIGLGLPEWQVQMVDRNPAGGGTTGAHPVAGRVYGAPFYLFRLRYRVLPPCSNPLSGIIDEVSDETATDWVRIEPLFANLLEAARPGLDFVYHRSDESMSLDGQHLIKNIPAKVLLKLLHIHLQTGRTVFENREFKRDQALGMHPSSPNFEARLKVLGERLEARCPQVQILKEGRGKFRLVLECGVHLREEA